MTQHTVVMAEMYACIDSMSHTRFRISAKSVASSLASDMRVADLVDGRDRESDAQCRCRVVASWSRHEQAHAVAAAVLVSWTQPVTRTTPLGQAQVHHTLSPPPP